MEEGSPGVFFTSSKSTKRVRASEDSVPEYGLEDASDHTPMLKSGFVDGPVMEGRSRFGSVSFRDKLMDTFARGERGPSIQFSKRAMDRLCKPWKNALIIKLLGRSHTYNYFHARLQQKWSLKGGWKLVDLVNDYFVVKFELEEDLDFVLTGGPWIIAGQYLVMQKWRPGFCPATAKITRMAAWIRVSALQLECFDVWSLKRIGNLLGKLLKIDSLTTSQNRGKFARLCVELDPTQPLEAFVQINQNWYNVEYEGLPEICFLCGKYGHKREACDMKAVDPVESNAGVSDEGGVDHMATHSGTKDAKDMLGESGLRGPWMIVQPRRNVKASFRDGNGKGYGAQAKGSRFAALRQVNDDFGRAEAGSDVEPVKNYSKPASSSAPVVDFSPKVWTKSQKSKSVSRTVLNDISNHSVHIQRKGGESGRKFSGGNKTPFGGTTIKERFGTRGEKVNTKGIVNDQIASWVNENDFSKEKGVYFFGHQPPNIQEEEESVEDSSESDDDEEQLLCSIPGNQNKVEQMDLSEGQGNVVEEQLADNTFDNVGVCWNVRGAASTKFKNNMMELIRSHLGFSGGLWLMWDDSKVHLDIIGTSDQSITASVSWKDQSPWLLTVIYANPSGFKREKLWEYLDFVATCHQLPWLLAGDFNEMLAVTPQPSDLQNLGLSCDSHLNYRI
ncbi:unnamed protein product [Prunus armeniaca]